MICTTCEGRGDLGGKAHWTDCVPGCEREHAQTCVSCMGAGSVSVRTGARRESFVVSGTRAKEWFDDLADGGNDTIGDAGAQRLMEDLDRSPVLIGMRTGVLDIGVAVNEVTAKFNPDILNADPLPRVTAIALAQLQQRKESP